MGVVDKLGSQGSSNNGFMGLRIRKDTLVGSSTSASSGNVMRRIRMKRSRLVGKEGSSLVGRKVGKAKTKMIFMFSFVGTRLNRMITPSSNQSIHENLKRGTREAVNNV